MSQSTSGNLTLVPQADYLWRVDWHGDLAGGQEDQANLFKLYLTADEAAHDTVAGSNEYWRPMSEITKHPATPEMIESLRHSLERGGPRQLVGSLPGARTTVTTVLFTDVVPARPMFGSTKPSLPGDISVFPALVLSYYARNFGRCFKVLLGPEPMDVGPGTGAGVFAAAFAELESLAPESGEEESAP